MWLLQESLMASSCSFPEKFRKRDERIALYFFRNLNFWTKRLNRKTIRGGVLRSQNNSWSNVKHEVSGFGRIQEEFEFFVRVLGLGSGIWDRVYFASVTAKCVARRIFM